MVHKRDGQRPASGPQLQGPIGQIASAAKKLTKAIRFRLLELERTMDDQGIPPLFVDQYPGKRVPFVYSKLFRPQTGSVLAINPTEYALPVGGNIVVASTQRFHWCRTGVFFLDENGSSDLFAPVVSDGGGIAEVALGQNFELELYDRTRARKLTAAPIPLNALTGGGVVNKAHPQSNMFEPGTEVEPRLFYRGDSGCYTNLVFMGFIEELV